MSLLRRTPFVPGLRTLRLLWRMLPFLAVAALLLLAARLLGASPAVWRVVHLSATQLAVWGLVRAVVAELLSAHRPELRVLKLGDGAARRWNAGVQAVLAVLAVTDLGARLLAPEAEYAAAADLLRLARDLGLLAFVAVGLPATGLLSRLGTFAQGRHLGVLVRNAVRWVYPLLVATLAVEVVLLRLGYVPLAAWVLRAFLWSAGGILAIALLHAVIRKSMRSALALASDGGAPPPPAAMGIERIGAGLLAVAAVGGAVLWVLAGFHLTPSRILASVDEPLWAGAGLTWGRLLGGFVGAGTVFLVGWILRTVLTFLVFPRSDVDVGARYAILAVLRYLVLAIAILLLVSALGVETSSLAWFLGAAGIGIGLGLQDVIANFFSGLLILLGRPFRVGDFVRVGDAAGTVEAIQIRGTTLRSPDNTTVVVPNRQMLGERLGNLTYGLLHRRVTVAVGASYDADPEHVREVLLATAASVPSVLTQPPPLVLFDAFGDSALGFVVHAFTAQVADAPRVASDLRYAIARAFAREGIEIPFPQRDVRIRSEAGPAGADRGGGPHGGS